MNTECHPETSLKYIPGIDGLRAIAILSVMLYHAKSTLLPGGFSGVDVFFVISGYVVSASLARQKDKKLFEFALHFYARRIVRIYPALVVCLVLVGVISTLIIPASWLSDSSIKTAMFAFLGLSNFALIIFNDGYFAPRVEFNAFTHTWSLAVEEQFYLIFPVVFFIWLKGLGKKGVLGFVTQWLLAVLLLTSLLYSWFETRSAPDHAFYLLPSRFWELACGALLFKLHSQRQYISNSKIIVSVAILAGLIMIFLGFTLSSQKGFPFPWALLTVGGTVFVIAGIIGMPEKRTLVGRLLDNPLMVYIGKISYSLYLWHWPIFVFFRWTVGFQSVLNITVAIALVAMMSILSYHYLETPIRKSSFVARKPDWQIFMLGGIVVSSCLAFSISFYWAQPYLSLSKTRDKITWYPHAWPAELKESNTFSTNLKGRKLFVVGDSHAGAYSTMFEMLKAEYGMEVSPLFTRGGFPVADLLKPSDSGSSNFIEHILLEIEKLAVPNDIVFLASLRAIRLGDQWTTFNVDEIIAKQKSSEAVKERAKALQEADEIITRLEKKHLVVMIDAPKPIFKSPPFRCSDWFNSANPICVNGFKMERKFLLEFRRPVMDSLEQLVVKHQKLIVWDPFPVLCPADTCFAFDEEKPLFFDGDHLSAHGNRLLYQSFCTAINRGALIGQQL